MTDTPRTDEAEEKSFSQHNNSVSARAAGWQYARQLERELAQLRRDKERLDWLIDEGAYGFVDHDTFWQFGGVGRRKIVREAIDMAREEGEG